MIRNPPGAQQLQRAEVDLLVADSAFGSAALFFAKAGGSSTIVSNTLAPALELAQLVEDVHRPRLDVGAAVSLRVLANAQHRRLGDVDRQHLVARGASASANPPL